MAKDNLSVGTLSQAMGEENPVEPVWQILNLRRGGRERYIVQISDGENYTFAMLTTQLNNMVNEKLLDAFTVIKVDRFTCDTMNGRRIIILLQLSVVAPASAIREKIGNPLNWNENGPKTQSANNSRCLTPVTRDYMSRTIPIGEIEPKFYREVCIKARVTSKGDIRTWSKSQVRGKLFTLDLMDDSGEIRMTAFNKEVDSFYDLLELSKVYYFDKFAVKVANKSYNKLNHHYEISFLPETGIYPCLQDSSDIPTLQFNFCKIADIDNMQVASDSHVDIIGVVKTYGDLKEFPDKSGKNVIKRELTIVDTSCKEISVSLWGKAAKSFNDDSQPVVAVKGAKVAEFCRRKYLSVLSSSTVQINPELPECHQLRGWFDNEGANATAR